MPPPEGGTTHKEKHPRKEGVHSGQNIILLCCHLCVLGPTVTPLTVQAAVLCVVSLKLTSHSWLMGNSGSSHQIVALSVICAVVSSIISTVSNLKGTVCMCVCVCVRERERERERERNRQREM
jgi:hypothetical protein